VSFNHQSHYILELAKKSGGDAIKILTVCMKKERENTLDIRSSCS